LSIMDLVNQIHEGLIKDLEKNDWILHHMRQAGHLAYRPSVVEKKLISTYDEKYKGQQWLRQHPLSGGGKIEIHWRTPRHQWVDEEGLVKKPKWEEQDLAGAAAQELRERRKNQYLDENSILISAEEQDIFDEQSSILQMHPAARDKKYTRWLRDTTKGEETDVIGMKLKSHKQTRSRWQYATQVLQDHYRDGVRADLQAGLSKEDLVEKLMPCASTARKSKKSKKSSLGNKLSSKVRKKWRSVLKNQNKKDKKGKVIAAADIVGAAAPGFDNLVGKLVLVSSEEAGHKSFGFVGKVVEISKGFAAVVDEKIKHKVQVRASFLQELTEAPKESIQHKKLNLLTMLQKRLAITALNARRGVEGLGAQELLTDSHISSFHEYLQWQYNEPGLRTMTGAEAMILAVEDPATFEHVLAKSAAQDKLFTGVTLVVPINGENHWTMLAVTHQNGVVSAARYYDSLKSESKECRQKATQILRALTEDNARELPPRRNKWHQGNGYDCGVAVCHYMEEELRAVRGEGLGRSWPQPKSIRERIQKYLEQLEREWSKWFLEQEKAGVEVIILDKDEVEEDGENGSSSCGMA
jgi:hypothetical protein